MISNQDFREIDEMIKNSIWTNLEKLRRDDPSNYVLFLADGEFNKSYVGNVNGFSPYVIDSRMDRYKDMTRLSFLTNFLNQYYSLPIHQTEIDDDEQRIQIELMIYTHIWEQGFLIKNTD